MVDKLPPPAQRVPPRQCGTCEFSAPYPSDPTHLTCRRYPPHLVSKRVGAAAVSGNVVVHPSDWCGEYKRKP